MELKTLMGDAYKEGMTVEDIEAALQGMDLVDRNEAAKGMVSKAMFDKKVSELTTANKQLREKMSTEEQEKLDREAEKKAFMDELEGLRKKDQLNQHLSRFLKLGYDEKLAQATAQAMVDQDFDTVFANQQAFLAARDKAMQKQAVLGSDKRPPASESEGGKDFVKMASEAQARGDFAASAYYTRLAQQNQ